MSDTLIIIPTYNEKENLERLISEIFRHTPDVSVLIVDDNSPDGTGVIADRIADRDNRVSVMHRTFRRERSTDALKEAIKRENAHYIMEMDADFSHDPKYIPRFLEEIKHNDIVIGSRFIKNGRDAEKGLFKKASLEGSEFFYKTLSRVKYK